MTAFWVFMLVLLGLTLQSMRELKLKKARAILGAMKVHQLEVEAHELERASLLSVQPSTAKEYLEVYGEQLNDFEYGYIAWIAQCDEEDKLKRKLSQ